LDLLANFVSDESNFESTGKYVSEPCNTIQSYEHALLVLTASTTAQLMCHFFKVYQVETTTPVQTMQTIIRITGSKSDGYGERWDNFTQTRPPTPTSFVTFAQNPRPFNPTHRIDSRRQPRDSPPPPTEVPPPPWSAAARQYTERNGMRAAHYWLGNPDAFVEVACAQEVGRRGARARRRWSISDSGAAGRAGDARRPSFVFSLLASVACCCVCAKMPEIVL
jgi:hypothetical protein